MHMQYAVQSFSMYPLCSNAIKSGLGMAQIDLKMVAFGGCQMNKHGSDAANFCACGQVLHSLVFVVVALMFTRKLVTIAQCLFHFFQIVSSYARFIEGLSKVLQGHFRSFHPVNEILICAANEILCLAPILQSQVQLKIVVQLP